MPKKGIHPKFNKIQVLCSTCNFQLNTMSTKDTNLKVDTCSSCHPFYTGKQQFSNTGRVERFRTKILKKDELNKNKK